jgi:AmiR/NasT family two-component response regulator
MPVEVLLVGHNPSDVLLIKDAALEFSSDIRITVAKDAQTAAALLFDPGFNTRLVITNMHTIPGMNAELFKRAKAKGVPVVVFSSVLNPTDIDEIAKLGATAYVEKPIVWGEFRNAVVGILSKWATLPPAPVPEA